MRMPSRVATIPEESLADHTPLTLTKVELTDRKFDIRESIEEERNPYHYADASQAAQSDQAAEPF